MPSQKKTSKKTSKTAKANQNTKTNQNTNENQNNLWWMDAVIESFPNPVRTFQLIGIDHLGKGKWVVEVVDTRNSEYVYRRFFNSSSDVRAFLKKIAKQNGIEYDTPIKDLMGQIFKGFLVKVYRNGKTYYNVEVI